MTNVIRTVDDSLKDRKRTHFVDSQSAEELNHHLPGYRRLFSQKYPNKPFGKAVLSIDYRTAPPTMDVLLHEDALQKARHNPAFLVLCNRNIEKARASNGQLGMMEVQVPSGASSSKMSYYACTLERDPLIAKLRNPGSEHPDMLRIRGRDKDGNPLETQIQSVDLYINRCGLTTHIFASCTDPAKAILEQIEQKEEGVVKELADDMVQDTLQDFAKNFEQQFFGMAGRHADEDEEDDWSSEEEPAGASRRPRRAKRKANVDEGCPNQ